MGWRQSEQSAQSSLTYIGPDLVVQRRSGRLYPAWETRQRILGSINDPDRLLSAAGCQSELDESGGYFWVQYQRHDLPGSPCHLDLESLPAEELEELFASTLPLILETERLLQQADPDSSLLLDLGRQESSKVHLVRTVNAQDLKEIARALGLSLSAPLPEPIGQDLSHGDALLKNIILTADGYRLIDWEAFGLLRTDTTIGHLLSWTLLRLPDHRWETFLGRHLDACLPLMERDETQARVAIYWQMIREALYWGKTDQRTASWISRAKAVLN